MVDEEGEPVEEEIDYEKKEEAARKRRVFRLKIIAVLVAVALGGYGVWYLFLSNASPEARFAYSSLDLRLSVNAVGSTDRDANIVSYTWDFGDGARGTGQTAVHEYDAVGDYLVTLTVTDGRGATGVASEAVLIRASPLASFVARHEGMTVLLDATYSRPSSITNSPIVSYAWDFGDGTTGSGLTTSHPFTQPGRYRVNLTVTDDTGAVATTTRFASPASTTVDVVMDQFFVAGCPYDDYWVLRFYSYGDQILENQAPCTDYYPWVLFTDNAPENPSYVYTLYRWDSRVRNHPGYSLAQPVMFPVFNSSAPVGANSYVRFNLSFEYLNSALLNFYGNTTDYPINSGFSDGFGYLLQGTVEVDLATAKRLFGMRGNAGGRPIALSSSGGASRWDGSSWSALPALSAAPTGPETTGWADLVVSSDLTAYAIATDSTVYKLDSGAAQWTRFINPAGPVWAKPATDIVGLVVDHDMTYYAITRGLPSPVTSSQVYRFTGPSAGNWTLVANFSAQHTTLSGGVADLALAGGTGDAAVLYALPSNARLPRDPVVYLPTKTIGTEAWTNPLAGVTRSNDVYANASADGKTQRYANFRIAPTGTETAVRTVEIGIEGKTAGDDDVLVQYSVDNGGNWTDAGTFNPTSTDTTVFFDVTGHRSWSFNNLSNAAFTTRIVYKRVGTAASVVSIDWLPVRVAVVANATFIRSVTGGSSWSSFGAPSPADVLAKHRAVAIHSPYDVHALLDNGSLLRTARGAASWSWIQAFPGAPASAAWEDVAWDGQGGLLVAMEAGAGPEVWRYDLSARTWTNVTGSLALADVVAISTGDMQQWWFAQTDPGSEAGSLESRYAQWLEENGNFKYDIYNGFEWYFQPDITDLNATVAPDGTVTIRVFLDGWGYDVLQARWFYWGAADYRQAVNSPYGTVEPQGWLPMETCWCEKAKIQGTIRSSLDLNFTAIQGYSFTAWANWGPDGEADTDDDLPSWVFPPFLMDYVPRLGGPSPAAGGYGNSELSWYEGMTSIHGTPGSFAYGDRYEYLNAPTRWKLDAGYTVTMIMPTGSVPWYDPVRSTWDPVAGIGIYVDFDAPMTLRLIKPSGDYVIWDPRAKVISMAGPHDWGPVSLPVGPTPWIEFGPETTA